MVRSHLYELMPEKKAQLELLPELELQIGEKMLVKFRMDPRTHGRPRASRFRDVFQLQLIQE